MISVENRKFSYPCVFNAPLKGSLGIWYRYKGRRTRMTELPDGRKSFMIGLTVYTQHGRVTDRRTDRHVSTAKIALA